MNSFSSRLSTAFIQGTRFAVAAVVISAFIVTAPPVTRTAEARDLFDDLLGKNTTSGWFWIVSDHIGQCLGTLEGKKGIYLQGCNPTNHHQQWRTENKEGSLFSIRNRARNKCMDVDGTAANFRDEFRPIEVELCKLRTTSKLLWDSDADQRFMFFDKKKSKKYAPLKYSGLKIKSSKMCAGLTHRGGGWPYRFEQRSCGIGPWKNFLVTKVGGFPPPRPGNVTLAPGWVPYGGGYETATAYKSGNFVTVAGLIKGGRGNHLATLPAGYRPAKQLAFDLNNHGKSARIDVLANGQIHWVAGGRDHKWLSLAGITFSVKPKGKLKLANGWVTYGASYGVPSYAKSGNNVTVSGLIKGGKYGLLAALPTGYRPNDRLVFDLNNHGKSARIDVLPDGRIFWVGGGRDHGSLSLSGITFDVKAAVRLPLASGWVPYGGGYKPPTYAMTGKIVTVSGLIKGGKYGHLATLPPGYRPAQRLVFDLNNHAKSARIDVLANCQIHWVAGGKDHGWLSLAGISFKVK